MSLSKSENLAYKPTMSTRSVWLNKEPADLTPSSLVQNMDANSTFYEHDPEVSLIVWLIYCDFHT